MISIKSLLILILISHFPITLIVEELPKHSVELKSSLSEKKYTYFHLCDYCTQNPRTRYLAHVLYLRLLAKECMFPCFQLDLIQLLFHSEAWYNIQTYSVKIYDTDNTPS